MEMVLLAVFAAAFFGFILGILPGMVKEKFPDDTDERTAMIRTNLPGNNCGGCGFAGCDAFAAAVADDKVTADKCTGGISPVQLRNISEILGKDIKEVKKNVYTVLCSSDCPSVKVKYNYTGAKDCVFVAKTLGTGPRVCTFGCMGYGSCMKVCTHGAISLVNNTAVIDKEKCTGCGLCAGICPQKIIVGVPYDKDIVHCKARTLSKEKSMKIRD